MTGDPADSLLRGLRHAATFIHANVPGSHSAVNFFRRRMLLDKTISIDDFDGDLAIDLALNENMSSQIFWYGGYSRDVSHVVKRLLRPGETFVDGGANIGEVTLIAARAVGPGGAVYSFEPLPPLAGRLRRNVERNGFSQVTVVEEALADRTGTQHIFSAHQRFRDGSIHEGLGTLYESADRNDDAGAVRLTRLDAFAAEHGLTALEGIKLDVEGAELPALKGARETLMTLRPWIVVELNEATCRAAGYSHADILQFLDALGYVFFDIGAEGSIHRHSTLEAEQDVLCLQSSHLDRVPDSLAM